MPRPWSWAWPPERIRAGLLPAAEQLKYALRANPRFMEWYRRDTLFDPVRARMDAILDLLPDPPLRS